MSNVPSTSSPKLSFEQASMICYELLPIGEQIFEYMERLQEAGFRAFLPFEEFILSFAGNAEEIDLHRRILVEDAKGLCATPWPLVLVGGGKTLFQSPLIQELKAKRDKNNGVSEHELEHRYKGGEAWWRSQIDPCRRHMAFFKATNRDVYDARWTAVVEAMDCRVRDEATYVTTNLAKAHTFDRGGRYALFAAVMERDAAALGFCYDQSKSRTDFPVFSKPVSSDWDLCWAIEEPAMFFANPFEGHFMPHLELRQRTLRGSISKGKVGEYLHFRYAIAIPGFFNAYRTFHSLDELETMIKAHLCLYGLMAPVIESGLKNFFHK